MNMEFLNLLTNIRTPLLTWINFGFSILGEGAVFIAFLCLVFWCIDKNFAYRLGIIYVISGLVVQTSKIIFRVPRPWIKDSSFHSVEIAKKTATGYSFPSGHTQNVTALYSTLALSSRKRSIKLFCFTVIFLVMFSRMYLGVHTPADVLGAFFITLIVSFLVNYYSENYSVDSKHLSVLFGLLFLLPAVALVICSYVYFQVPDVITDNLIDVLKSSGAAFGFLIGSIIEKKHIRFNEHAANLPFQIIKYVIGICLVLLLNVGFDILTESVLHGFLPMYFLSHAVLILFIICIYPIFIKKFFTNEYYL